jgi:Flp pilus assembly protein CpaB
MSTNNFGQQFGTPPFSPEPEPRKGGKGREKSTRRAVNTQRTLFIVFAVLAGLLATLAVTVSSPVTYVARTTVAVNSLVELSADQWEVVAVDPDFVEEGAYTGDDAASLLTQVKEDIASKRVGAQLAAKQQLRESLFIDSVELSTPLLTDERLISISARAGAAIVGTVRPGDRIDLYANVGNGVVGLLGSDVEVVMVSVDSDQLDAVAQEQLTNKDKNLSDLVPGQPIPGTYVLRVNAADVPAYVSADATGSIHLSLRGKSAGVTPGAVTDLITALCAKPGNATGTVCRGR